MIKYLKGDATQPQGEGQKLVIHIVNDLGRFGSGFAKAVMERHPIVRQSYLDTFKAKIDDFGGGPLRLGDVQFIRAAPDIWFANMCGQHGIIGKNNPTPIKYDAVRECLKKVYDHVLIYKTSVHAPRFGSGLAGGKWEEIEKIIDEELICKGLDVMIYDLV